MAGIFGQINPPISNSYFNAPNGQGLFLFLTNLFKLLAVGAGIFFVVQVIMAGYGYISANGDAKKTEAAFAKIWQSIIGMGIIAASMVITAIVERLTGIQILNFQICGPNGCVR